MYVCVSCMGNVRPDEVVIMERDEELGEIAVRPVGGPIMGYLTFVQPNGCLEREYVAKRIKDQRVLGRIAIISGDVALVHTESRLLIKDRTANTAVLMEV